MHPSAERKINKRRITAPYILPDLGKYGAVLYMSAWQMLSLLSFRVDCKTLCPSEVTYRIKPNVRVDANADGRICPQPDTTTTG